MTGVHFSLAVVSIFALTSFHALVSASDPGPLQDFCVAINNASSFSQFAVFVNGKVCKDPKLATADDFFFSGLKIPKSTENAVGSTVTPANVEQIAGLNTLGISQARIDFAPNGGLNPPHYHPRASEILLVLEGTLNVGFITSNPEHRLISKVLNKGDVFVFPNGLIHFQLNTGPVNAVAIASFSSQNPGLITVAKTIFGSNPPINPNILSKAFQVDNKLVGFLQKQFSDNNK